LVNEKMCVNKADKKDVTNADEKTLQTENERDSSLRKKTLEKGFEH